MDMQAVVVVTGEVDERDVWPYAVWTGTDGTCTTLTVAIHDSRELVGVLATLTGLGLEVTSMHVVVDGRPSVPGHDTARRRRDQR
jgi:hypothetical protein